jgi:hypothetical protein
MKGNSWVRGIFSALIKRRLYPDGGKDKANIDASIQKCKTFAE